MDLDSWWANILEIIIDAGIVNGFLFTLLFIKWKRSHSQRLLSLTVICLSIIIFKVYYFTPYMMKEYGVPFFGTGPFTLLLGPLLYLYLRSIVLGEDKFRLLDFFHLAPFLLYFVLILPQYFLESDSQIGHLLEKIVGSPWIFLVIQLAYYLYQSRKLYHTHKETLAQSYSNVEGRDMSWFDTFLKLFFILLVFLIFITPTLIHGTGINGYFLFSALFFTVIQVLFVYKGIPQKVVQTADSLIIEEQQEESINELKQRLLAYMDEDKPFLQPDLSLVDLAKKLNVSRNQLSGAINNSLGENFYNFINKYRIEEVKRLISEDSNKRYTVIGLAQNAGFNSKSTFNHFFKKSVGMTPSEYRDGLT